MNNPRTIYNKNLYKFFISILKYVPIVLLILFVIGLILNYIGISAFIITCISGTSAVTLILLYLLSYIFRFCYLYRLPLHYITLANIILILNKIGTIVASIVIYRILAILLGLFLIIYIVYWYKNRNKPKVDPIKNFCERYCECC